MHSPPNKFTSGIASWVVGRAPRPTCAASASLAAGAASIATLSSLTPRLKPVARHPTHLRPAAQFVLHPHAPSDTYLYDGQNIVLVLDAGNNIINRYLQGTAMDQTFAEEQSNQTTRLLADHEGSIRDAVRVVGETYMDDTFTVSGSIGPINGSIGYNTADHYWVGGAGVSVIPFQGAVNYSAGYGWSFGPDGTDSPRIAG